MEVCKSLASFMHRLLRARQHRAAWLLLCGRAAEEDAMVTEEWIRGLIKRGELWKFYKSKDWVRLKESVLRDAHYECAECRARGIVTRYDIDAGGQKRRLSTVHHVMRVRQHPELALSRTYRDRDGAEHTNLIPVCKACHNRLHPEKRNHRTGDHDRERFTNEERW